MEDCIFCKIIRGEIPCNKIYEDENFIAILDVAPQTELHTLVISKEHFKTLLDFPEEKANEFLRFTKETAKKLMEKNFEGFNLVVNTFKCAGQIVDHFHMHILPRKKDDGYSLSLKS